LNGNRFGDLHLHRDVDRNRSRHWYGNVNVHVVRTGYRNVDRNCDLNRHLHRN
jgi:hypothetical protein